MLGATASVAARFNPNAATKDGATPLFIAAHLGHAAAVKTLLELSPPGTLDVDKATIDGQTPLSSAMRQGHTEVVRLLQSTKS